MNWEWAASKQIQFGAVTSVILIVTVLVVKKLLLRAVLRLDNQQPEVRRRWVVNIRNASLVGLLLGLIMILAEPLHTLAVSFIALAVAVVIATKTASRPLAVTASRPRVDSHAHAKNVRTRPVASALHVKPLRLYKKFCLGAPIASDDKLDAATQGSSQIDRRLVPNGDTFDAVVFTSAEYEVGLRNKLMGQVSLAGIAKYH